MSRSRTAAGAFALAGACFALRAGAAPANETPEQLLARFEADAPHKAALSTPLEKARAALARARSMDHTGDQAHAALMRAVARQWLDVARDLVRAVDVEAKASAKEKTLDELETKITRGQALLEETVARRARAQALLEQVERAEPAPATAPKGKEPAKPAAVAPAGPASPGAVPPRHDTLPPGASPGGGALRPPTSASPGRAPVPSPSSAPAAPLPASPPKGESGQNPRRAPAQEPAK